jgi:hypothetical protein
MGGKFYQGLRLPGASPTPIFARHQAARLGAGLVSAVFRHLPAPAAESAQNPEPNENWKRCTLSPLSELIGWAMLNDSAPKGESQRADRPAE